MAMYKSKISTGIRSLLLTSLLPLSLRVAYAASTADCTASSIAPPSVFGAQTLDLTAQPITNWQNLTANDVCLITLTLTHPGTNDLVTNTYALPLNKPWNRVFQGIGGGGFMAGTVTAGASQTALGYAIGATDAGLPASGSQDASPWALVSPGNVNQDLLLNFGRRSLHDMTVLGKSLAQSFYGGAAVQRAYWNGCSTGGRQGLVLAQYYPSDYDGILADAPAVQWNDFTMAQAWPFVVQNVEGYTVSPCEQAFVVAETVRACDALDGLVDGLVSAPALCGLTAQDLVGRTYACDEEEGDGSTRTFTQAAASVIDSMWTGARVLSPDPEAEEEEGGQTLWYGLIKGANFSAQAPNIAGNASAQPFRIADSWIRALIAKDLSFDTRNMSYDAFADVFLQGHLQYDSIMGSASPDLLPFKQRGGKIITWQGLADGTINPQGTMFYYQKVLALDPDAAGFYRQFFSPGVGHCGGGTGVIPIDAISQLRTWVENGTAPETLRAASTYPVNASSSAVVSATQYVRFLDLCPWPAVNKYRGSGDPAMASSWECATGTGWQEFPSSLDPRNYSVVGGSGWYGSSFPSVEI